MPSPARIIGTARVVVDAAKVESLAVSRLFIIIIPVTIIVVP